MVEEIPAPADLSLQKQQKQRGRPFTKGQSGNPAGRPPGIRNHAAQIAELLLAGEAEALTRKAVEVALRGEPAVLRLCLERLVPPRRERTVPMALPAMRAAGDLTALMTAVVAALAGGDLSPSEASEVGRLAESLVRVFEANDFERRLRQIEERHG